MDDQTSGIHLSLAERGDGGERARDSSSLRGAGTYGTPSDPVQFWVHKLAGAMPLQLPLDRPRRAPELNAVTKDWVRLRLSTALKKRLENIARQRHVSLFAVLFGSWAMLLTRWCAQDEVLVGARWSGLRPGCDPTVQRVAGFVPLRFAVDDSAPVEEVLRQVEKALAEAEAHANVRLRDVLEAVQSNDSDAPLLRAVIALDEQSMRVGARHRVSSDDRASPQVDLALMLEEVDGVLGGRLEYHKEFFDRDTICRMADSWNTLLQGVVKHARRPSGQLGLISGAERDRVVYRNNATALAYPREKLIHELFEEQARLVPQATALICRGQTLTYAELNTRSNRLARYLRRHDVMTRDRVAIFFERSVETVVGILGVLKAGAAYVPLDPNYPIERLAYLLEDSTPTVVLTQSRLKDRLPGTRASVIAIDEQCEVILLEDDKNQWHAKLTSDDLAYVMYTSGSTGQPKGVMVRHRNVVNYSAHAVRQFDVEGGEGSLIGTSMSFDLALTGFYPPLICGRAVTLCAEDEDLSQVLLSGQNFAPVKLTPTHLSILSLPEEKVARRIRTMVVGGELLQGSALRWWREHSPETRIFNHYGPTEATIGCVVHEVSTDFDGPIPIGKPISNAQIYILNAYRSPVPAGVVGEIYIGGDGVAAGYWNRPELTAERFVLDPFIGDPHARMYRTGDLGRWRSDGLIEYLGRNDDQVKIRGFRVELGEIGARLVEHNAVKEAIVVVREEPQGDKRLVAYITQLGERRPVPEALRAFARSRLPDYMVPAAFVVLERFPLTENGKLDRRALPAPDESAYARAEYEPAQGWWEESLAKVWQHLLKVEQVGRNDNFFALGGHSLLIVQLMESLRQLGLSTDVRAIYDKPTLRAFATTLVDGSAHVFKVPENRIPEGCEALTPSMLSLVNLELREISHIEETVPGGAGNIQDIYPLAPLQEGILFHHLFREKGGDTYVLPTLIELESEQRVADLIAALQSVINRHDILRTAILWEHLSQPVQVVCRNVQLPVGEIALESDTEVRAQLDALMEPQHQWLDLTRAPLLRLQIAKDPSSEHWFAILQAHHIVSDHESTAKMLLEVVTCLHGRAGTLPRPARYRDHVAQARAHARTSNAEAFFRAKLGDIDEPTAPFGLFDVRGDAGRIRDAHARFDADLTEHIRGTARRLGVSPATLFHAAWALVVSNTSGREDIIFGTLLLGRMQGAAGAQGSLGMFINTLPLRFALGGISARGLIEQTRIELVELLNHEQASLAVAQRCSGIGGSAPLFSAVFNFVHGTPRLESLEGGMPSGFAILARREWTNYPIVMSVEDRADAFALIAQTDRRIDPQRVIQYLQVAMQSLLNAVTIAPETPALKLPILPLGERRRIIDEFNATQRLYPRHLRVTELFERQVCKTPDSVSIIYESHVWTYAELNRRANQLAHLLLKKGLQPSEHVAILMERSPEQVVAQIAVLKCGGVYVPIDPQLPTDRKVFMVADTGARHVLVNERSATEAAIGDASVTVVNALALADEFSRDNLILGDALHAPAYVMYTSGSTGTPKGVVVPQHAVVRLVINNGYAEIIPDDCIAYCSNPTFDASTFEVWGALLNGARLLIVPQGVVLEAERLANTLQRHAVTILWLTVGLFSQYADALAPAFARLRYLMTGGDVVDPGIVRRVLQNSRPQHVLNAYGPTECTTFSTTFEISAIDASTTSLPIGRPIANAAIYILNSELQPVPIGAAGEIYIGGDGLAFGYLGRPKLTEERFIADPLGEDIGARLYRTGDFGRWREDGNVEFLGRNDQQVKVRGYRIELGEIEAQLTRLPQVNEAVVVAREETAGPKWLVAYVTTVGGEHLAPDALRADLAPVLPAYMIPSAFVVLPHLPLTPNGKLDRRALPAPDVGSFASRAYDPPSGEIEEMIAGIWAELLRIEQVGRGDDFFDLGGHSLLAMQVMVRVRALLSINIPIGVLFDRPMLSEFSAHVKLLREERLMERLEHGGIEIDELLEAVSSMSELEVSKAMEKLSAGTRP